MSHKRGKVSANSYYPRIPARTITVAIGRKLRATRNRAQSRKWQNEQNATLSNPSVPVSNQKLKDEARQQRIKSETKRNGKFRPALSCADDLIFRPSFAYNIQ